jgi:PDZ domain-containing protein
MIYQLPYYIYKPGLAGDLDEMVEVEGAFPSKGHLHLVTVSGGQATPFEYVTAKILPFHEIVPLEKARPEGMSDEEYMQHQLHLMENSQHSSTFVAYKAANKKVELAFNGVYVVQVLEEMPAEGILKSGDRITQVDDITVKKADDLVDYVTSLTEGKTITLHIVREGKQIDKKIQVVAFDDQSDKVGIGITLVTDEKITAQPGVKIKSGNIGGPSAGLMFALEMYNQLTKEDITKGYNIAGTGEIDFDGKVHRIGGIDKKIVAADKEGVEFFFAPNEQGAPESNFEVAKETAEQIGTKMQIIPVDSFQDALDYLENLEPKA